jgi:hypothetical protein
MHFTVRARNGCSNANSTIQVPTQKNKYDNSTLEKSMARSTLLLAFLLISLLLICFGFSPTAKALTPEPDGDYPNFNTAEGSNALNNVTTGSRNTALGVATLFENHRGDDNTAAGAFALNRNDNGSRNTATGAHALRHIDHRNDDTAMGYQALEVSNGSGNTAIGSRALERQDSGIDNIALGFNAGGNLTDGSNNIDIGNRGERVEGSTIRIGSESQTRTFIAGISGTGVTGAAVQVNAAGQLGTAPSSARFKEEIRPMDKASEAILALQPVTFRYKKEIDPAGTQQFGLVAEKVEKVSSDLVVHGEKGKPYSVRYDQVNAMLLNEFLKARRQIDAQQKQIDALTAGLQKVSAQLEASKPAPQVVNNP